VASLSRRFAFAFVILVAVPSVIVSVVLSRLYVSAIYSTLSRQTEATAEQVSRGIQSEIDSASILAASLLHDSDLRSLMEAYSSASRSERLAAYARIDTKIADFLIFSNRIGEVAIYLKDGSSYFSSNYPNLGPAPGYSAAIFSGAERTPGTVFLLDTLLGPVSNIGEKNILSVAVCPTRDSASPLKAILVMTRVPFFDELAARAGPGGGDVAIFGREGLPLLSSLRPEATASLARLAAQSDALARPGAGASRELRAGGRRWLATSASMESAGWKVVLLSDMAGITGRIARYSWYLFPALAVIALLSVAFVRTFLASIAAPIRTVVAGMGRVGRGDYGARASSAGIAELEALTQGFNSMVAEIDRLVDEKRRREHERLLAELEALRYQINPHFVANTLSSIRLMARAAKADAIAAMSGDLMRVLADSYSGSGSLVELSREVENVKSYIAIMKVRFGRLLEASFDLESGAERLLSLRMMLQPVVENCILHGFAGFDDRTERGDAPVRGHITISARLEAAAPAAEADVRGLVPPEPRVTVLPGRNLVIEVRDDGSGMDASRLASVLEEDGEVGGLGRIGIANVRRRLLLNFGEPYGLSIESAPGTGTLVTYVLPAMERLPEEEGAAGA
jgi:two-component system, sensor histidine kinase YesM